MTSAVDHQVAFGQALAHMDLLEKAVNEIDAKHTKAMAEMYVKLSYAAQPVQQLLSQMQELRADNHVDLVEKP